MVADHDVFERRSDGVAEVQRAGDVGRWHADDEGAAVGILAGTRLEVAVLLPPAIQAFLDGVWLVGFGEEIHARAVPIARAICSIRSVAGCICALLRALGELVARLLFRRHRLTLSFRTHKSPLRQGRKRASWYHLDSRSHHYYQARVASTSVITDASPREATSHPACSPGHFRAAQPIRELSAAGNCPAIPVSGVGRLLAYSSWSSQIATYSIRLADCPRQTWPSWRTARTPRL